MTAPPLTKDRLYALPTPVSLPDPPASPAAKVTGRLGVAAVAIAAAVVIVALTLDVSAARTEAATAREEARAAHAETVTAREAATASDTRAEAEHAAALAANSALTSKTQQLVDLRAVAVRASSCMDGMFAITPLMLNGSYAAAGRALTELTPLCIGLGPQLKGAGGV